MFKNAGKLSDADKKSDFSPLKNGTYIFTVKEAEMGEADEMSWNNGVGTPTGGKIKQLTIKFSIEKEDGTNEIENDNGVVMVNPVFTFWVNEGNLGWYKRENKPKGGRAILTALLGIAKDGDVTPALDPEAIIGMKLKAYMTKQANKNGVEKNILVDPEPVKKN